MSFTVTARVVGGLAIIVLIGVMAKLITYQSLLAVESKVHRLAKVEAPLSAAAYEMEINSNGLGLAVLKYLNTRNPEYREWVDRDVADFAKFHATYAKLVKSVEERQLAAEIISLHRKYTKLAETMLRLSDDQETLFDQVSARIELIDELMYQDLRPAIENEKDLSWPRLLKATATANLEAEIAEVGFWLANYRRLQRPEFKAKIDEKSRYFERVLAGLEGSKDLTDEETEIARAVREHFEQIKTEIAQVVKLEDRMLALRESFLSLRDRIDVMLDSKIQVLALRGLDVPRAETEATTEGALRTLTILLLIYLVAAIAIGIALTRSIIHPLRHLKTGAKTVGTGDLSYRIPASGADEFSDLAGEFNRMVEQLRETTVSKSMLQGSEKKLSETVTDLRHEIAERESAEAERSKLQAALRRSETMSVMGALVAGVAHEVRNPLFGMSSTLDAIEARFAGREEYQRYNAVLRGEVDRLSKLMADLLDYGKPRSTEMSPASVGSLITQAVQLCMPLFESAKVMTVQRVERDIPEVRADRARLLQVFCNLLENALQHAPEGSEVCISAKRADAGSIVCTIEDAGFGFAPADLPHVFEPFFTRRRGGTGLGLSIVARIVEDHGGTVLADNREERGARVMVSLPPVV